MAVDRGVIRQGAGGHLSGDFAVLKHANDVVLKDAAHHGSLQAPTGEALHQRRFPPGLHHEQHPLLGLAQQELVGGHPGLSGGHAIEIQLNAQTALGGHL